MKINALSKAVSIILAASSMAVLATEDSQTEYEDGATTQTLIITTGTSKGRLASDTPLSVTTINDVELEKLSFSSQADIVRAIPAIKAEGGGGEVASNIFVRGLPSGGQFQYTPLLYDGSPTLSIFGLNSSAFDVYYRNDLGLDRLEFVRGGVSNLFGAGSVAGVINYISKKGGDFSESSIQLESAEDGRMRNDFATSGPLSGKGLYYAVSGFYRYDKGPLDTGIPTEGYQLRANLHKDFEDQTGSITFYTQIIEDRVQFYLPLPLDGATHERLRGNDGQDVESVNTNNVSNFSYPTLNGNYVSAIEDGVYTNGTSFSMEFNKELSDSLTISGRAKYANYEHEFNLFLDGDGAGGNLPENSADFLTNRELGDIADASFTYVASGQVVASSELLFANRVLDRARPVTDFSSELNLTKSVDFDDFSHEITVGAFFSNTSADDDNVIYTYLGEFNNNPRLVNLTVVDIDGSISGTPGTVVTVSNNGLTKSGNAFSNKTLSAKKQAFYIADQFENDNWIFDVGLRFENIDGDIEIEGTESVMVNGDPALHPDLQNNVQGSGVFTRGNVSTNDIAVSAAALYRYSDNMNIYGNFSRGYFFPELRGVKFNSGIPSSYEAEIIKQVEFGLKYFNNWFTGSAALFYAGLDDRRNISFINDDNGGVLEFVELISTESVGVELVGKIAISDNWSIDSNLSFEDHEFIKNDKTPENIGKRFRRKPTIMMSNAIIFNREGFDASLYHTFNGDNFANDGNTIDLNSFNLFNLDVGYSWDLGKNNNLRTSLSVFNLTDSQGITEGSPRQGSGQVAGQNFFVGRPILPRRITFRIKYDF